MEKKGVRGLIARGGYDLQERPAELNLTGVMVTFRTRSCLDLPEPWAINPSLPAGRVALRCGGNVLGDPPISDPQELDVRPCYTAPKQASLVDVVMV